MTQLMNSLGFWNSSATRHTPVEDVQGIFTGTLWPRSAFISGRGRASHGSTAGIAFLLHYALGVNFGLAFFLLNVPFFYLSWRQLGPAFTSDLRRHRLTALFPTSRRSSSPFSQHAAAWAR